MQAIVNTVAAFIQGVLNFFKPAVVFFISCFTIVSFVLGAILNPQGFINSLICGAIDIVSGIFPSTPPSLKIGNIINSIGDSMPAVGCAVVADIFQVVSVMFTTMLVIKIYKLIPFKAS